MLYYQLNATFHFEPYRNREELLTEPDDRYIRRFNQRMRRAFVSAQASAFSEFAACCRSDKDGAVLALGLETTTTRKALSIVEKALRDAGHLSNVHLLEPVEISSQQMLSGLLAPASDTGLLQDFPFDFETWDAHCEPDEFQLEAGIENPAPLSLEDALAEAKSLMLGDTFLAEIRRIYDPSNVRALVEHPVHYRLAIGHENSVAPAVGLLVRCLHSVGRLPSVRYDILKKITGSSCTDDKILQLFQPSSGATVVLATSRIADEDEQGLFSTADSESLDKLTEQIKHHHRKTLFIFVERHPHEASCDRLISAVDDELRIVELGEGRRSLAQAQDYLKQLICSSDLKDYFQPEALKLPEQDGYTAEYVQNAYAKWRERVLRERIYPTYQKELSERQVKKDKPKAARQKLMSMVGLTQAKAVIQDMVAAAKLQNMRKNWGIKDTPISRHMVFTGNPGSAKTTVARLTAKILAEEGIISKPYLVECGRASLVGKYVGWTANIVRKRFHEAIGGVLFIDEAYALVEDHHSFGDEAINTIVQEMENKRDSVIVILAGYTDKMEELLDKNEGLRSRIAFHVDFPDYAPDELGDILGQMCEKQGYRLTDACREKCAAIFENVVKTPYFGNGRFVRNLFEQATLRQAKRLMETGAKIEKEQGTLLLPEDFETLAIQPSTEKQIGFC